jgi:hypothetical protein
VNLSMRDIEGTGVLSAQYTPQSNSVSTKPAYPLKWPIQARPIHILLSDSLCLLGSSFFSSFLEVYQLM